MIELRDKANGERLGTISEQQLQFLIDQLEEESSEDRDYYITRPTLDMLEEAGGDADLVTVLRRGLRGREEMEIKWRRV
ncbi:MAG: galactosyldiacylglycerol synthase [Gemmatimonadales bacterium]